MKQLMENVKTSLFGAVAGLPIIYEGAMANDWKMILTVKPFNNKPVKRFKLYLFRENPMLLKNFIHKDASNLLNALNLLNGLKIFNPYNLINVLRVENIQPLPTPAFAHIL